MSTMNMCAPPQTYSRLFRPWDTKMESRDIDIANSNSSHIGSILKTEYCSATDADDGMDTENIDIMNSETSENAHTDSEDNECSLSNSSADSSINPIFDDCASSDGMSLHTPPPLNTASASARNTHSHSAGGQLNTNTNLYNSNTQFFQDQEARLHHHQLQQQQQQQQLAQSQHYQQLTMFSGIVSNSSSAANNSFYYAAAAAAAAVANIPGSLPNFNIDPYPLGLMEQEYARVMAEEAHLKALNARKQRPKKFKCPHCDVAFSNNGQLKGHIRIHTGERPFKCDAEGCGKTFTRNEELTRHKRIHTGLRPFPCPACGKKFGRRDHLKKHMKTHMPQEHPLGGSAAFFMPVYPYMYGL